jgi:VWFA-related protein
MTPLTANAARLLTPLAAVLLGLLVARPGAAQQSQLQVQSIIASNWPTVQATVTAFDEGGQPISGLMAEDLSASVNGQPASISSVQTASDPGLGIAVVLAFDVSGSMAGEPLDEAKVAGKALISQLADDDQAAVVAFGSQVQVTQAFTPDKAVLEAAIDGLVLGGDTALYGGVQTSAQLATESGLPRNAIVLLSDGYDFGGLSAVGHDESLSLAEESGALVLTVGLGGDIDQAYLSQLAAAGRGQFLLAPAPHDLTAAYDAAGEILKRQYIITIDGSAVGVESTDASLLIEANLGGVIASVSEPFTLPQDALPPVDEPEPQPEPEPEPEPAPEPIAKPAQESEGIGVLPVVAIAVIVLGLGGGLVVLYRRRRDRHERTPEAAPVAERIRGGRRSEQSVPFPEIVPAVLQEGGGAWIEVPEQKRVSLGEEPVTIGPTSDYDVRIEGAGLASFRIWRRGGNYMIHNLSRTTKDITVGGKSVTWAILEDGDEISMGSTTLVFHDGAPGSG